MFEYVRVTAIFDGAEIAIAEGPGNMRDARESVIGDIYESGYGSVAEDMDFSCIWEDAYTGAEVRRVVMTYGDFVRA
jgi:hypothetical protein